MRRSRRTRLHSRSPLLTLLLLAVLMALDGSGVLRVGLACALLHEGGHVLAYRALCGDWPELEFSPLGICLLQRGRLFTQWQQLLLAVAGPLANLAACTAVLLGMCFWGYSFGGYWFACCNLLVGGSNLLPLPGLDGWQILCCLLHFVRE